MAHLSPDAVHGGLSTLDTCLSQESDQTTSDIVGSFVSRDKIGSKMKVQDAQKRARGKSGPPQFQHKRPKIDSLKAFIPFQDDGSSLTSSDDTQIFNNQTSSLRPPLARRRVSIQHHHPQDRSNAKVLRRDLSCCESDIFSDGASNDLDDDVFSQSQAQSARCRSPTPTAPSIAALPTIDPDMKSMLDALCNAECTSDIDSSYLDTRHGPSVVPVRFIDAAMRRTAIGWLVEVSAEFRLSQDALHLAASLLDRFLSTTRGVPRSQLQLLSVSCLLSAAKHEEEQHPSVQDLSNIADNCFSPEDLLRMEAILISSLGFRLSCPTAHTFVNLLCGVTNADPAVHAMAAYLSELAMLEYSTLKFKPSQVALGAISLAATIFNDHSTPKMLPLLLPASAHLITPCVQHLSMIHNHVVHETKLLYHTPSSPVVEKFRSLSWHGVSMHQMAIKN